MMTDNQMHIGFKQVLRRILSLFVWRGAGPLSPIKDHFETVANWVRKMSIQVRSSCDLTCHLDE